MAAWCLPRSLSNAFLDAIRDGTLAPERLTRMTSEERRVEFAKILGEENAREVNAQFESKMLLKDQQRGLVTWAKKVAGISEATRRDLVAQIGRMDKVLQPQEQQAFLEDLAAKKLGVSVTEQEAREIFQLSQKAEVLRAQIVAKGGNYRDGWTRESGTDYGRAYLDLKEKIESLKPGRSRLMHAAFGVYNIPREIQTGLFHFSAPFVQLWGMISTPQWWRGLRQMYEFFGSEDNYRDLQAYIIGHPDHEFAVDGKLGLTDLGTNITKGEEGLQTHLLSDMWESTGAPNPFRASQRAFVGTINYVRFARFADILQGARMAGVDIRLGSQEVKDIASVVNNFTGRGPLGLKSESSVGILNALFYAPRKVAATVQMFNPVYYAKLTPYARQTALRQLAGSLLVTGAVMTLAKVAGAKVDFDPRASDFGKIDIGGEKLDMTGGNAVYLRFLTRLITGEAVSASGHPMQSVYVHNVKLPVRAGDALSFTLGKLAPVASIISNAMFGSDPVGRPFSLSEQAYELLTPIVIHSFIDYAMNNPEDTAALIPSLAAFLGVGLESPLPPPSESGRNTWGDPMGPGTPAYWRHDPVNQEMQRIGVFQTFPQNKIRGQQLTPDQFDQYVHLSGNLAHQRLEDMVGSTWWSTVPDAVKAKTIKAAIKQSREMAAITIMLQAQGSANDIAKKAYEAKAAASGVSP